MLTKKYLTDLIKGNSESIWTQINSISVEENRRVIEEFLNDLLENDPDEFNNKFVLNLIYALGKISNAESLDLLLKIGISLLENKNINLEVLDALGGLVDQNISNEDKKEALTYLESILDKYDDESILSSIVHVLNSLSPELKLKEKKPSFFNFNKNEISEIILSIKTNG